MVGKVYKVLFTIINKMSSSFSGGEFVFIIVFVVIGIWMTIKSIRDRKNEK